MANFSQTFEENALRRRIFDFLAKFLRSSFLTVGALRTLPRRTFSPPFAASLPRISGSRPVFAFAAANCRIKIETVSESGDSAPGADPSLFSLSEFVANTLADLFYRRRQQQYLQKGALHARGGAANRGKRRKMRQNALPRGAKPPNAGIRKAARGCGRPLPFFDAFVQPRTWPSPTS